MNTESVTQRHRVRKVTRVIRDVDAWSVFKVAIVFHINFNSASKDYYELNLFFYSQN
jgi:hypothetical protein